MLRTFSTQRIIGAFIFDILATMGVLLLSLKLRFHIGELPNQLQVILENFRIPTGIVWKGAESEALLMPQVLFLVAIIWPLSFITFSVYDGKRCGTLIAELRNILLATTASTLALAGILYFSYRETSRLLFLIFFSLNLSILILSRVTWWAYRIRTAKHDPQKQENVLIIGAGEVGRQLQENISLDINTDLTVIGFLDDDPAIKISYPTEILGATDDVRDVVSHFNVQDVVLALPRRAYERVNQLVSELHDLPVRVWVVPDYFSLSLHKARMVEYANIPMLDLRAPALSDQQRTAKRIFDIFITLLSLVILLPIMIIIAVALKIDSPGPAFFKQKRVGENGRLFEMIKFRSMILDADEQLKNLLEQDKDGNLIYKRKEDPRITRVGKYLRRTSLDELPQFFNVLLGDMSLVGPRPEIPLLVEQYEPWQRKRFAVPQGITGWWQIHGRSDKPMHLHTEEDIFYVQNYSLLLDLKILFKTPIVVLRTRGAF